MPAAALDPSAANVPHRKPPSVSDPIPRTTLIQPHAKRSDAVVQGPSRAAARSYYRATGLDDADFKKPMIAVVNTYSNVTPCNMHLDKLAEPVREGVRAAGGVPIDFNTIVVSDGISMGTPGMRASLVSREVIADSIELAVQGHTLDGVVVIVGCDKTIPAAAMALARMNVPGLVFYGGTIMPGKLGNTDISIQQGVRGASARRARARWTRRSSAGSRRPPAPARAPAAASSPPTPWP